MKRSKAIFRIGQLVYVPAKQEYARVSDKNFIPNTGWQYDIDVNEVLGYPQQESQLRPINSKNRTKTKVIALPSEKKA